MPSYRRNFGKGGTYCFTVVTYKRQRILNGAAITILRESFRECMNEKPFTIEAIVVLPEHIHCIWKLPAHDSDYSARWKAIKSSFTKKYINRIGKPTVKPTESMQKKVKRAYGRDDSGNTRLGTKTITGCTLNISITILQNTV